MFGAVPTDCCCTGERYLAYPCWPSATRSHSYTGASAVTVFNGTTANSSNPPTNTPAIMLMQGGGGGGRTGSHGGGGVLIETSTTLPASSTVRVGRGGPGGNNTTTSTTTVFGGGARGAAPVSGTAFGKAYGGGASGWSSGAGTFAGAGGGSGSPEYATIRGTPAHGGDAGLFGGGATSSNQESGQSGTANGGGIAGIAGGAAGALTASFTPANGGLGVLQTATGGGGGGGGGGKGSGGGGGNYPVTIPAPSTSGGAGGGGSSFGYNADRSHPARNGLAHASHLNPLGDGGIGNLAGQDGAIQFVWRTCTQCPCPEMVAGLPPALFICLTQEQFNALMAAAGPLPQDCTSTLTVGFKYKGFPYWIQSNSASVDPDRGCDRVPLSADLTEPRWVSGSGYCCNITRAIRINTNGGCFSPCAGGCPDEIYLCEKYLTDIGVPICRLAGVCHEISYLGCTYYLAETVSAHCQSFSGEVINQGTYKGTSASPCDTGKQPALYDIGCEPFVGGLECGMSGRYQIDWTSAMFSQEQAAPFDGTNCTGAVAFPDICGNNGFSMSANVEIVCMLGDSTKLSISPQMCMGGPFTLSCTNPTGSVSPQFSGMRFGQCDPANPLCQGQPGPCTCPHSHAGQFTFGPFTNSACPDSAYEVALTITRACPMPAGHPLETSWATLCGSCNDGEGEITIQQCTFVGQGRASYFATAMQTILGGDFTITGSNKWLGLRCRECGDPGTSCKGCTLGDDWVLLSISNTTAVFGARTNSCWYHGTLTAGQFASSYRDTTSGACLCCGTPCCGMQALFDNTTVGYEVYGVLTQLTHWAGGFVLAADFSTCGCLPVSVQGAPIVTLQ